MKLKSLFLVIIASLALTTATPQQGFTTKQLVIAATATIGIAAVAKYAYDYFFQLTDAQEFQRAMMLCDQGEKLFDSVSALYHPLLLGIESQAHPRYFEDQFYVILRTSSAKYPLYSYVCTMNTHRETILNTIDDLSKTKITIFARRSHLIEKRCTVKPAHICSLEADIDCYTHALEELVITIKRLSHLNNKLFYSMRNITMSHRYIIEEQNVRIEALEKQVLNSALRQNSIQPHTFYGAQPININQVYIHNTKIAPVTQVNEVVQAAAAPCKNNKELPPVVEKHTDIPKVAHTAPEKSNPKQPVTPSPLAYDDTLWKNRFHDLGDNFNS